MKAVFTHKAASLYDDKPEERYHFPETYLRAAEGAVGDFILCYEPGRVGAHDRGRYGRRAYVAVAQVTGMRPDPARQKFFYADIDPATYVTFDRPVSFREDEHYYERQLRRPDGGTSKGAFGRAVRPISDQEFTEILSAGFAAELSEAHEAQPSPILPAGMMESAADFERPVIERILSRPVRDAAFRHAIQAEHEQCRGLIAGDPGQDRPRGATRRPVPVRDWAEILMIAPSQSDGRAVWAQRCSRKNRSISRPASGPRGSV